jgi:phosphate transport system substrate-binding protein
VLAALETQFEAATTGIDLNILSGTTTAAGIQGVLDGVLTAAALLRPLNEEEAAQGVQYATIGQTAVAFIVHPSLDINELTSEQARAIFMGEITNWSQVGGEDAAIVVFARSDSEAHTTLLRTTIFGDAPFPEALVTIAPSHSALLTAIELTPNAIGYTVWGAALASKTQAKPLTLDKVSVTSPDYPILVEMGLGYLTDQQATIQVLLDWLTSDNGRVALAQFGTIQPTNIP